MPSVAVVGSLKLANIGNDPQAGWASSSRRDLIAKRQGAIPSRTKSVRKTGEMVRTGVPTGNQAQIDVARGSAWRPALLCG
jgi:hypothetical protein